MYDYLLYFLIFSFLGWCVEVIFSFFKCGRVVNRGFAKGPICPIYGVGITLSYLLLGRIESFLLLALLSMAIATVTELAVGFFFDKLLGVRLWDYSGEKGNIGGYVCPRFSLIWGIASAAVIRLIPLLAPFISLFYTPGMRALVTALFLLALVDVRKEIDKTVRRKNARK
jgi:uncharacterized membrane protein